MKPLEEKLGVWQYFMLFLSVFSLLLVAAQTLVPFAEQTSSVLTIVDTMVCLVFFGDFCWQLLYARSRREYLKWGWLDLLSSIPMLPAFRLARLARIARIVRVLRGARAIKHTLRFILLHRARNTFSAVLLGSFVLLLFATVAIMNVEPVLTGRDAFWWCLFTLITGEYGDFYPNTTEGRCITALLMTAGVALFGTFTASVASFFLEADQEEDARRDQSMAKEIATLSEQISDLKLLLQANAKGGETNA
jgi:voltage-gated potassium channel